VFPVLRVNQEFAKLSVLTIRISNIAEILEVLKNVPKANKVRPVLKGHPDLMDHKV